LICGFLNSVFSNLKSNILFFNMILYFLFCSKTALNGSQLEQNNQRHFKLLPKPSQCWGTKFYASSGVDFQWDCRMDSACRYNPVLQIPPSFRSRLNYYIYDLKTSTFFTFNALILVQALKCWNFNLQLFCNASNLLFFCN
jgi:hypothetical protein